MCYLKASPETIERSGVLEKYWKIRIIKTPKGEAPEWVRASWVGVEVPVDEKYEQPSYQTAEGALSKECVGSKLVYVVCSLCALCALELVDKKAHQWWMQNAPEYFEPSKHFLFDSNACEYIGTPKAHFNKTSLSAS